MRNKKAIDKSLCRRIKTLRSVSYLLLIVFCISKTSISAVASNIDDFSGESEGLLIIDDFSASEEFYEIHEVPDDLSGSDYTENQNSDLLIIEEDNELKISSDSDIQDFDNEFSISSERLFYGNGQGDGTTSFTFEMRFIQSDVRDMLNSINSFRRSDEAWLWNEDNTQKIYYNDLSDVEYDYGLERDAMQRAAEVALIFSHERPNGERGLSGRSSQSSSSGENIASGYRNAESVFIAWKDDEADYQNQKHRQVMLTPQFNYVGLGHVYYNGRHIWVQEFASEPTDLTATEPFDGTQNVVIDILNSKILENSYGLSNTYYSLTGEDARYLPDVTHTLKLEGGDSDGIVTKCTDVTWTSEDSGIVRIDGNRMRSVSNGTTTLTATLDDWSGSCSVSVYGISPPVEPPVVDDSPNTTDSTDNYVPSENSGNSDTNSGSSESGSFVPSDNSDSSNSSTPSDTPDSDSGYVPSDNSDSGSGHTPSDNSDSGSGYTPSDNSDSDSNSTPADTDTGSGLTGLSQDSSGIWHLYENGHINTSYNGLYYDERLGWWLVLDGNVAFDFYDLYCDPYVGWWKVAGGTVDFGYSDLYCSPSYGWWKISGGSVDFGYNDLYCSPTCGWWKIAGGAVDFGYNDLYGSPAYGWWKINGGSVDFGYNDLYGSPTYGWWKIAGGSVDFGYNDLYCSPTCGWWLITGGSVDFGYNDIFYSPVFGPWKVTGGSVDFNFNGHYNSQRFGGHYISGGFAS